MSQTNKIGINTSPQIYSKVYKGQYNGIRFNITINKLFENEYNKMLNINGIKPANSGISADEMRTVLSDTLGAMPKQNVSFDNNGFSSYLIKGGSKTKRTENRASGFGLKF